MSSSSATTFIDELGCTPCTAEMLRARLPLETVGISEYEKLEGCVTCLRCACAEPAGVGATKGRLRQICCRLTPIEN